MIVTNHPDGSRETWSIEDGYERCGPTGVPLETRPLTPVEEAEVVADQAARDTAVIRDATAVTLHDQARAAYADNQDFITAAATVGFPLSVGSQQALVAQTVDLTKQVNALIRLAVANDMLD